MSNGKFLEECGLRKTPPRLKGGERREEAAHKKRELSPPDDSRDGPIGRRADGA
jgi:hypothetical protein